MFDLFLSFQNKSVMFWKWELFKFSNCLNYLSYSDKIITSKKYLFTVMLQRHFELWHVVILVLSFRNYEFSYSQNTFSHLLVRITSLIPDPNIVLMLSFTLTFVWQQKHSSTETERAFLKIFKDLYHSSYIYLLLIRFWFQHYQFCNESA